MEDSVGIGRKRIHCGETLASEHTAEAFELGLTPHRKDEGAVFAMQEVSVRGDVGVRRALSLRRHAVHEGIGSLVGQGRQP